jgi:hypothetical protein
MSILSEIESAFAHRSVPTMAVMPDAPNTTEYVDAMIFAGKKWREVTCQDLDAHSDAIFGFTPEAFCYFLPGIYTTGISQNRRDMLVNTSLIQMLDRSNVRSSWDKFFISRWPLLTRSECEVSQQWVLWLTSEPPPGLFENSLSRAFDTLQLLKQQAAAVPLASR